MLQKPKKRHIYGRTCTKTCTFFKTVNRIRDLQTTHTDTLTHSFSHSLTHSLTHSHGGGAKTEGEREQEREREQEGEGEGGRKEDRPRDSERWCSGEGTCYGAHKLPAPVLTACVNHSSVYPPAAAASCFCIRQHTSAYVIRPHTSAYAARHVRHACCGGCVLLFLHTSAYVSIRPHTCAASASSLAAAFASALYKYTYIHIYIHVCILVYKNICIYMSYIHR
jgi:hypothetical protein